MWEVGVVTLGHLCLGKGGEVASSTINLSKWIGSSLAVGYCVRTTGGVPKVALYL